MIAHVRGKLVSFSPTFAVVEVGGVGLHIQIPVSSYTPSLRPGDDIHLLTYLHVREDALALYGFATEAERGMFLLLIDVAGIGPPLAQRILSGIALNEFTRLVAAEDVKGLTRIKGVGAKLAQRLVFELRDKLRSPGAVEGVPGPAADTGLGAEAAAALTGLGVDPLKARKIVHDILQSGGSLPIELLIKEALKRI